MKPLARGEGVKALCHVQAEGEAQITEAPKSFECDVDAVVVAKVEVLAQQLGQRPVRDAVAVREAAAGAL